MKITKLKSNPSNPRFIKDDNFKKLVNSLKEFPKMMELRPIIVDDKFIVLGGNMRYKALIELGYKEIPDEWVKQSKDLTEDEKRQFIVKDNLGYGEWDWDILANEWDKEELIEWGLDVIEKQDWGTLEYIDEAEQPNFSKKNLITIVVPDDYRDSIRDIEELIKHTLGDKYSGCEVK